MRALTSIVTTLVLACAVAGTAQAQTRANGNASCGTGPREIIGRPASASDAAGTRVAVLPDTAVSRDYITELRVVLAARHSPADAFALIVRRAQYANIASSALRAMQTATTAANGSFRCGALPPGHYLVLAFISVAARDAHAALDPHDFHILVASATIDANADSAITAWTSLGGINP